MTDFSRRDLIDAWLAARSASRAAPELRDWHARRYHALANAFGVVLERPGDGPATSASWLARSSEFGPAAAADPTNRWALHDLFTRVGDALLTLRSPFADYLEAPAPVVTLLHRWSPSIDAAADDLRDRYVDLMEELLEAIWGVGPGRVVSAADLHRHGFDVRVGVPEEVL